MTLAPATAIPPGPHSRPRVHDIHPHHRRLQRRPHLHSPHHRSRRARNLAVLLRQNAPMTAAHADPSRPVPILGTPRHQPAWIAVDPSTQTTRLDPP